MLIKLKKNYFLLISTCLFLYFFFNLVDGERGLISYFKKKEIENELIKKKDKIIDDINILENKNLLLTKNLDLDFIEILIREKFLFGKKDEKIYIIKNNEN
jgi:cell division protein DivIC